MKWISTKDRLPEDGQTVLVFSGSINIATLEYGISMEERKKMERGEIENPVHIGWNLSNGYFEVKRSESYGPADEQGNNTVPYFWRGKHVSWFGQDVSHWMPLPDEPKEDDEDIKEIEESIASIKSDMRSLSAILRIIVELCSGMNKTGTTPKWYVKATGQEYNGPIYLMEGVGHTDRFGNKVELR